ncbi:hypothetical protein LZ30DRAFT_738204 [Colletotrichum cereale]|nr:hypothetical protein LZ30DRAFT_738204 [Colletotrichum cereale]
MPCIRCISLSLCLFSFSIFIEDLAAGHRPASRQWETIFLPHGLRRALGALRQPRKSLHTVRPLRPSPGAPQSRPGHLHSRALSIDQDEG